MYKTKSDIYFYRTGEKHLNPRHLITEHSLIFVYSGILSATTSGRTFTLKEGEAALFARNNPVKFIEIPANHIPFQSVALLFPRPFLKKYFHGKTSVRRKMKTENTEHIYEHPLLESFFSSLFPYFKIMRRFPKALSDTKLAEALDILRAVDIKADKILSDFSEPDKKDIGDFMRSNFMFNLPIRLFAYLSGRKLEEFKDDFQKIFGIPPGNWLLKTRLEHARYLIAEKKISPSEAYVEAGFRNFSGFVFSFKKFFGYNPSVPA